MFGGFGGGTTTSFGGGFGANNAQKPFGTTNNAFQPAGTTGTTFGGFGNTTAAAQSPFGGNTNSNQFGATQNTAFGGFGQQNSPTINKPGSTFGFGGNQTTTFGGQNPVQASPFGQPNNTFGQQTASAFGGNTFGQQPQQNTSFGQQNAFGQTSNLFGGNQQQQQQANPTPFGQQSNTFGAAGTFGSTTASSPFGGGFGTNTFGQQQNTGFGGSTPNTTTGIGGFGSIGGANTMTSLNATGFGGFGGGTIGQTQQLQIQGTGNPPFTATPIQENVSGKNGQRNQKVTNQLMAITAMSAYDKKSFEELRLEDYSKFGKAGNAKFPPQAAAGGMFAATTPFGAASTNTAFKSTSPFGAQNNASTFGKTTTAFGGFGTVNAAPTTAAPFGSTATTSFNAPAFGNNALNTKSTSPFGTNTTATTVPTWGTSTLPNNTLGATSTFGFGTPNAAKTFTTPPANTGFGSLGNTFGAAPTTANAFGFGQTNSPGFGTNTTLNTTAFGQPNTTGFGTAPTTTQPAFPAFGTPNTGAAGFGFSKPTTTLGTTPTTGTVNFGTIGQSTTAFGLNQTATKPGGGFGFGAGTFGNTNLSATTPQATFSFNPQQNAQQAPQQQTPIISDQNDLASKFEHIRRKKDILELNLKGLNSDSKSPFKTSVDQSITNVNVSLPVYRHAPNSAAKVQPRGFGIISDLSKSNSVSSATKSLMTPEVLVSRNTKTLVIDPQAPIPDLDSNLPCLPQAVPTNSKLNGIKSSGIPPIPESFPSPDLASFKTVNQGRQSATVDAEPTGLTPSGNNVQTPVVNIRDEKDTPLKSPTHRETEYQQPNTPIVIAPIPLKSKLEKQKQDDDRSYDKSGNPPTLKKTGYHTLPSIELLETMTDDDLSEIREFRVWRPGYGEIKWEGFVDIRGLNLDRIIHIGNKMVSVYEDYDETSKPPVGKELNRPAIVTLQNVFPKKGATPAKQLEFVEKLKKTCDENGSKFIDYNSEIGEWIFRTEHFSKYGLLDSDDDDDEEQMQGAVPISSQQPQSAVKSAQYPSVDIQQLSEARLKDNSLKLHLNMNTLEMNHLKSSISSILKAKNPKPEDIVERVLFDTPARGHKGFEAQGVKRVKPTETKTLTTEIISWSAPRQGSLKSKKSSSYTNVDPRHILAGQSSSNFLFDSTNSPTFQILKEVKERLVSKLGKANLVDCKVYTSVSGTFPRIANATGRTSTRPSNMTLFLGRSFRVGWSSTGKLVSARPLNPVNSTKKKNTIYIESPQKLFWGNSFLFQNKSVTERLFDTLYSSGEFTKSDVDSIPHWTLPCANMKQLDEYLRYVEMLKELQQSLKSSEDAVMETAAGAGSVSLSEMVLDQVISLFDTSFGQEPDWITRFKRGQELFRNDINDTTMPLLDQFTVEVAKEVPRNLLAMYNMTEEEYLTPLYERRRQAFAYWLQSICEDYKRFDIDHTKDDVYPSEALQAYADIFQLLTFYQVYDAIDLAEKNNLFRLAMNLNQIGGDDEFKYLLNLQIEDWNKTGAASIIPAELLQIYYLMSGVCNSVLDYSLGTRSIMSNLSWINSLGIIFWYCGSNLGSISSALLSYNYSFTQKYARPPIPQYQENSNLLLPAVERGSCFNILFSLLNVLYVTNCDDRSECDNDLLHQSLRDVLNPLGYTHECLDYSISLFALTMLTCVNMDKKLSTAAPHIARQHAISQLIGCGKWQWAVFAALQITDKRVRDSTVKDIMLRFGGTRKSWEEDPASLQYAFFRKFSIPDKLIHEATAYHLCYENDRLYQAIHLNLAGKWYESSHIICRYIVPEIFFKTSKSGFKQLENLLLEIDTAMTNEATRLESLGIGKSKEMVEADYRWISTGGSILGYLRLRSLIDETVQLATNPATPPALLTANEQEIFSLSYDLLVKLNEMYFGMANNLKDAELTNRAVIYDIGTFLFNTLVKTTMKNVSLSTEEEECRKRMIEGLLKIPNLPVFSEARDKARQLIISKYPAPDESIA